MLVAKQVTRVHGVELSSARVKQAQIEAARQNLNNISFSAGSVIDYPVEPNSFDVVLFLACLNKETSTGHVGLKELERLLPCGQAPNHYSSECSELRKADYASG